MCRHVDNNDGHDDEEKDAKEGSNAAADGPPLVLRNVLLHIGTTVEAALHDIVVRRMLTLNNLLLLVLVKLAEAALASSPQASTAASHWPHAVACAYVLATGVAALKIGVVCHGELRRCCHLRLHLYHLHLHD